MQNRGGIFPEDKIGTLNHRDIALARNVMALQLRIMPILDSNRHIIRTVGPCCCAAIILGGAATPPYHRFDCLWNLALHGDKKRANQTDASNSRNI